MRSIVLAVLFVTWFGGPALAADAAVSHRATLSAPIARPLPFPRTERAAAVWNERACWSQCGAYCAWGMANCLERDAQGVCLDLTNSCDRTCLRTCRTRGGPYVGDILDF